MTIIKFFGNYMVLFEVKRKSPNFPKIHTTPTSPDPWRARIAAYRERLWKEWKAKNKEKFEACEEIDKKHKEIFKY